MSGFYSTEFKCFEVVFPLSSLPKCCTITAVHLLKLGLFSLRWENRIRSFHSGFDLINQPSMYCFVAKSNGKIKSSSRKWGEGAIIVESFICHSQRSCWEQDNYTICSQSAAKTFRFSLLKVLFNSPWVESIQFIFLTGHFSKQCQPDEH